MKAIALLLLVMAAEAAAQDKVTVTVAPYGKDRRWVLVEVDAKGKPLPGTGVSEEKGTAAAGQPTATGLAWLVPFIPAGEAKKFTIDGTAVKGGHNPQWVDVEPGIAALKIGDKEITRYHTGPAAEKYKHHKPFFWPLIGR